VWCDSVSSVLLFGLNLSYKLDENDCVNPLFFFLFFYFNIDVYTPIFSNILLELLEVFYFTSVPTTLYL
jgi:hypothetical protein